MVDQTIWLAPKATAFTVPCEQCAAEGGYGGMQIAGRLPLERWHSTATCPRGHLLRVERANREPIGVLFA